MGTQKTTLNHPLLLPFSLLLLFIFVCAESTQYSITGYDPEDLRSEDRVTELFLRWREKHRKIYGHAEETLKRFENFKRNLRYVIETNSDRPGVSVGLNRFADLSNEEFREKYTRKVKKPVQLSERWHTRRGSERECHAPRHLDWRQRGAVTAVKDQGDCVWSVIRCFDHPQIYRKMIKSCALVLGWGEVGSTRLVKFKTGLSGTTSLDRLERMDEERHVMVYKVIGGDQKLLSFELSTSLHEVVGNGNKKGTMVTESYTVDVPEDSSEDDTCLFANTVIQFNLKNLAYVAERIACVE